QSQQSKEQSQQSKEQSQQSKEQSQQSKEQSKEQQSQQSHALNSRSALFIPGRLGTQPSSHDSARPAPQITSKISGALNLAPRMQQRAQDPGVPGAGWADFAAHIEGDNRRMLEDVRQGRESLGGETIQPEFRETFKRRGREEDEERGKEDSDSDSDEEGGVRL
ncbi:uncharacterized protein M421DRAFT_6901, partial [Didymella exigua CBS 183.55]